MFSTAEQIAVLVNRMPAALVVYEDADGWPLRYISDGITRFGIDPEQLGSEPASFLELIHPEDQERVRAETERYCRTPDRDLTHEYRIASSERRPRWVLELKRPERDENGLVTFTSVLVDITDRKLAEEELKIARVDLERRRQSQSHSSVPPDPSTAP